jgi:hypothetical protein
MTNLLGLRREGGNRTDGGASRQFGLNDVDEGIEIIVGQRRVVAPFTDSAEVL